MIWKNTFKKTTGLTLAKSLILAFLAIFLFSADSAYAQVFTPDGDFSASEYAGGQVRDVDLNATGTCNVKQVYSIVKSDIEGPYLLLGFYNGNAGQATFRYYIDTDPTLDLVSETFKGESYSFPGADVVLQVNASGNTASVFKYNGTSLVNYTGSGIIAAVGDYDPADDKFIEIKIPLSGDGSIIDVCDLAEGFNINLGSYISFAGKSITANVCNYESFDIDIAVNGSIDGSSSYCSTQNSTVLTLSGNYGAIVKWQKNEGLGWTDIANTSNIYTATDVAVTTSYRAIIVNNTCPGNEVETGTATITINEAPTAEAGQNMELTCTTTSVTLNGSGDSNNTDADLSYAWTGPEGFTSSEAMPGVSVVGTYTLTVTDNDNGCFVTDSVEVTQDITAPTAEAGENMELTCATTSVTLNGSGNSTNDDADLSYAWTGPGEFSSDMATPSVTVEGTYTLTVTDNDNGCFATDTVEVTKDANVPTASIDGNDELNCNNTEITLNASGSVVNGTPSYSWTMDTADGTEVGTQATLEVTAAGVYVLTVTDLDNGCFDTNSVEVIQDNTAPTAEAGDDMELTCTTTSVTLNGSGDSTNTDADLSYAWTGPEGFTSDEAMPGVSVVGIYTLTVTDNDNGCFVTDSVEVTQDINAPTAEAGENMELTCATTSVTLNGSGNSTNDDADLSYAWTGPGEFSSDMATPSVTVEGIYTLTVTDNDNGCFATDTVEVTKDANVPTASIDGNEELNCNNTEITLDASGSVVNGTPSYSWTMDTADGTEVGTQATLEVTAAGVYVLTVTDLDNGCFATNSVEVIQDNTAPTAEAGDDMELTCTTTSVTLNGSGDSTNTDADLSYAWTGPEGFTSSEAMPGVSVVGTYTLTVTDNDNGCFVTDSVEVTQDITAPTAEAGENMELTCATTSVTLNGSG
ncbi:PKD domain-containing protein, partial [Christiangramia sp. ASW11-125]|uniref:PKD domain-containing protein n=1 Tax=Christiangramia sp. ASW11-125 TaxID=3400701 RepID=UPI003AADD5D7